jgi:hypothetical protein
VNHSSSDPNCEIVLRDDGGIDLVAYRNIMVPEQDPLTRHFGIQTGSEGLRFYGFHDTLLPAFPP